MAAKKQQNENEIEVKNIKNIADDINKQLGADVLRILADSDAGKVDVISTGSLSIDIATGIGGIPRGRVTEIYGAESSGKTTLCLNLVKQCQTHGGKCVYIDAEHAIDLVYAKKLGINVKDLLISQPSSGEEALNIVEILTAQNSVDLIIVDSVAALAPQIEIDGSMDDSSIGAQARMLGKGLRKIVSRKNNVAVVFINQLRTNIGVMFGNPNITPGGKALKFSASMRIELSKKSLIKKGDMVIGQIVGAKVVKNKNASPHTEAEVQLIFGKGFNQDEEIVRLAVEKNIITQKGAWYYYQDKQLCNGKETLTQKITNDPDFKTELLTLIQNAYNTQQD